MAQGAGRKTKKSKYRILNVAGKNSILFVYRINQQKPKFLIQLNDPNDLTLSR
jgi:hypothetical protein